MFFQELRESLRQHINELGPSVGKHTNSCTLIIDGHSLKHALSHDLKMDFLELCMNCKSVICCRVSPMQKAEVRIVKKNVCPMIVFNSLSL